MKLIIDIDEKDYDTIKNLSFYITSERHGKRFIYLALNSIKNGMLFKAELEKLKEEIEPLRYGSDTYKYAIDDVIEILDNHISELDNKVKREGEFN